MEEFRMEYLFILLFIKYENISFIWKLVYKNNSTGGVKMLIQEENAVIRGVTKQGLSPPPPHFFW
jgi:hypothetical protein